ncbi:MAG: NAD(P)H-binding protein [Candidatus Latescibacterota bacterium]
MDLHGKRVFITGITSPLGGEIAGLLTRARADVVGLVRDKRRIGHHLANVDIVEGDCQDTGCYRDCVRSSAFIIHAAGLHLSSYVIRACAGHDHLRRIVFISSMRARYPDFLLCKEEARGKRVLLEQEREIATSLLPWTILRPTLIFSVGDRSFARVRQLMTRRRVFPVPGNGHATRQPISARDLAASTIGALLSASAHRKSYDLPGEMNSVLCLLETLRDELGIPVRLVRIPRLPVKMMRGACNVFGLDKYGAALTSFLRWYYGFDWSGDAAACDFAHAPRSFRQNVREQIVNEASRSFRPSAS